MAAQSANSQQWLNKTVWVTGANQGIGAATAEMFLQLGANVIGFDQQFAHPHSQIKQVTLDISNEQAVKEICQSLLETESNVDALVNVAGILQMGKITELSSKQWQRTFDVNVSGAFNVMQQAIPVMKAANTGAIVSVSSNATHMPRMSMAAYSASKAALTNLTMVAGIELAEYGIRCNVVSPGSTQTPMQWSLWQNETGEKSTINGFPEQFKPGIPLGKLATPEDIAETIVFLCSSQANHITLQDIVIDGGATLGK
ncbi:2,3-dihydro-2,3-dihydroxybenzoate dehydrogenase [Psychromonas sp. B3M02]|uniref:2,3-dihydro-2,3-dihydroxybenzoate dehydrogenase n=1 Tax=Psychromonas sp. B3M02 TaxID=2267226 RepID=UPI000DEB1D9B|nr:2,3-dihydro-2,3-dihydroxybenzoate dehydrogenase [Psychromonas sp. B3M02]RBW41713.1 2,3-dihydro-2,3-dihydroxybenzoate dehydrogenase [Psychromonas sp. B3M02]